MVTWLLERGAGRMPFRSDDDWLRRREDRRLRACCVLSAMKRDMLLCLVAKNRGERDCYGIHQPGFENLNAADTFFGKPAPALEQIGKVTGQFEYISLWHLILVDTQK